MVKIIRPSVEVERFNGVKLMKRIERACRTCYRSENNINDNSYHNILLNCVGRGHESVLEHEKITVRFITEIGAYKDFTRHRLSSFSIESTRYCGYDKDKFGNELTVIKPEYINDEKLYKTWLKGCQYMEKMYMEMKNNGGNNDQCRELLNHSIAAEVVMTANIREWRHILSLRCSKAAHPSLRIIFIPLLLLFKKEMPELFDNIDYDKDMPKEYYANICFEENPNIDDDVVMVDVSEKC